MSFPEDPDPSCGERLPSCGAICSNVGDSAWRDYGFSVYLEPFCYAFSFYLYKKQCLIKSAMAAATLETFIELLQMKSFFLDRSSPVWPDSHCILSAIVIILGNSNVDSDVSNPVLNSRRISQNSPFPRVLFLWSHNSSGKVTRTLHSHPHCQQSQNLCKISTFWIWGATSIPWWCIAASEAESSHISTVFCPIRNAVSEGGQLSKKSICHKAKKCTQWLLLGLNLLLIPYWSL